jgi:hypothetical protein
MGLTKYVVEMASGSMMHISFINIGTGNKGILRFLLKNFSGCNVDITDGRDLRSTPWYDILTKFHEDWYGGDTHTDKDTHTQTVR